MADLTLTKTRIQAGVYEGVLTSGKKAAAKPELVVLHQSLAVEGLSVTPDAKAKRTWTVRVPIPAGLLSDGVQTFLIKDEPTGDTLDAFTIIAGLPLEDDIRAEIDLLRAELEVLKSAFRRHCSETRD